MSAKYSKSKFEYFKNSFLSLKDPKELAGLLDISYAQLIKKTRNPVYTFSKSVKYKGRQRTVEIPADNIKYIQNRLNKYLQAVYFFYKTDAAHGFVKSPYNYKQKYSIVSNARPHCGKEFVITADIFRFFSSIRGEAVRNVFLVAPFNFDINLASAIALLCINKNWLPTGAPTSPVISNFVCINLDADIEKLAKKYNYVYTRYADDLTFSGETRPDKDFKQELQTILTRYSFQLNRKKYRVNSKHSRQMVTGIVVNEKLNVNRDYIRKLRAKEHNRMNPKAKKLIIRFNEDKNYPLCQISNMARYSILAQKNYVAMIRKANNLDI